MPSASVTDDHVVVPSDVREPVVVTFEGRYVWSFVPPRDGSSVPAGWQVPWPEPLRKRLDGTTAVQVRSAESGSVYFDGAVSFGDNPAELSLTDPHGHPLAIDRAGHLTRVFGETDTSARQLIVEGTARALDDLRTKVGIDAHLSYGALLGAVREGRMIAHDSDADLAYLSTHTHPADIVLESYRIERGMRSIGWRVVRMSGADLKLFLPLPDGRNVHVDVFGAFHVGETFYQLGGRSGRLSREALTPASTVVLEGVELAAPADPERVLEFLYGEKWRVPDPAFKNVDPAPGIQRLDGWLRGTRTNVPEWNELLRTRRTELPREPSTFALWVEERIPGDAAVVDIGAGNGRDSVHFAERGHRVTAFDYSGASLRQTRRKIDRLGAMPDARVLPLNDVRAVLLAGAELAREAAPPHLYARQLLGCLDEEGRTNLWRLSAMALRRGGSFHLEYVARTPAHTGPTQDGLVRRLDPETVTAEIEASGGHVVHSDLGPGTDFLDQPDPAIARLVVRWDPGGRTLTNRGDQMSTDQQVGKARRYVRAAASLPESIRELRASVQENRQLNRRIAELTDLVAELLVPLADRDEEKARELLARYRETTLAP
jgi:SAM-dependent methyltransferase